MQHHSAKECRNDPSKILLIDHKKLNKSPKYQVLMDDTSKLSFSKQKLHSINPSTPDFVQNVGKYRLLKTIGKGNFAKVKLALHLPT
ncbi:hypothetical protein MXB_4344, partial [Myxobolus squamalis]